MKLWRYGRAIEQLGQRYRLEGVLGSGGMADVCLAWDERDEREVAIKVIKPGELDQRTLDRFLKEAAQVAQWRHPHILRIFGDVRLELLDAAQGSIVPYIVMEYAQGGDLHRRLRPGTPYPLTKALRVFEQLCLAVTYAHEQGVIHRDLKPLNILFRRLPDGAEQVVLSDFGLAVEVDATHFTFAGGGTLPYMAPEQLRGKAEPASDIFALGVILYQLCTGNLPFKRTLQDLRRRGPESPPPAPSSVQPTLPDELDEVIFCALAEQPALRFATANLFWEHVHAALSVDTLEAISRDELDDPQPRSPTIWMGNGRGRSNYVDMSLLYRSNQYVPEDVVEFDEPPAERSVQRQSAQQTRLHGPATGDEPVVKVTHPRATRQTGMHAAARSSRESSLHSAVVPAPRTAPVARPTSTRNAATSARSTPVTGVPVAKRGPSARGKLLIGTALLLLVLLGGGMLALATGGGNNVFRNMIPGMQLAAVVTITPDSKVEQNSFQMSAVTGTPNPQLHQVALRPLTFTTPAQTKQVTGTGHIQTASAKAMGQLTFFNGSSSSFTVPAGTPITAGNGVVVTPDVNVNLPGASIGSKSTSTVQAHAADPGSTGNISALAIDGACCAAGNFISVENQSPFTGGQDSQNYTFIQQSDVNTIVDGLSNNLNLQAQNGLKAQRKPNEQLINQINCKAPDVKSDHPIGDTGGANVTSATLTISETCTGLAYDQAGAQALVRGLLVGGATGELGSGYKQVGDIVADTTVQNVASDNSSATLVMNAKGVWVYDLSSAQLRQHLLGLIAGRKVADAENILKAQTGVGNAKIVVNGGGDTLPTGASQIRLDIAPVAGLRAMGGTSAVVSS